MAKNSAGQLTRLEDVVEGPGYDGEEGALIDPLDPYLNLTRRGITQIRSAICWFTSVTSINLSFNCLKELPSAMGGLTSLNILQVKSNSLRDLPSSFSNLKNLTHLKISDNCLTRVPDVLKGLESLAILHMNSNPFEEDIVFPASWRFLRVIDITECNQKTISPTINHLKGLEELYIGGNFWNSLPPLHDLKELVYVCMDNMKVNLGLLPECLAQVESLKGIDCNNSGLQYFPEWLASETFPANTNIGKKNQKTFPPIYFGIKNLDWLGFADNQITHIPKAVAKLSGLDTLIVKGNPIKSFPVALHEYNPNLNLVVASNSNMLPLPKVPKNGPENAWPPLSLVILAGRKVASQKLDLIQADLPRPCLKLIQTVKECSTLHCNGTFIEGGGMGYQSMAWFPKGRGSTYCSYVLVDINTCDIECTNESPKNKV